MEALSPEMPPSNSSPPLNIIIPSNQYILPPIRNLPAWSRTNLGFKKTTQLGVKKNQVVKTKDCTNHYLVEQWTQTSPTVLQKQSALPLTPVKSEKPALEKEVLERLHSKKIVFLQSIHSEVLQNLQKEIEQLKNENKALQFSLVMANGNLNKMQTESTKIRKDVVVTNNNTEMLSLRNALLDTKNELTRVQEENKHLCELLQRYVDTRPGSPPSNMRIKNANSSNQGISEKNLKLLKFVPRSGAKKTTNDNIGHNKSEDDSYTFHKNVEARATLRNKIHWNEIQTQGFKSRNLVLPRLNNAHSRNKSTLQNKTYLSREQSEPITLPVLQSLPVSNLMTVRQKRGTQNALHMKRKRSNKDVSVSLSTNK